MSGFTSSSSSNNIKTEIVRLVESQKEKASLLAYFTKYQDQQTEVFSDLSNFEADEDLVTLRLSCLVTESYLILSFLSCFLSSNPPQKMHSCYRRSTRC
ncbi:hypothetical protein RirG_252790 [Rhizophagus irregularis DAOM 197198w]|uniref:Uncharacterized protein n=1 Tax=Rhizophagus irregularis (strain DAOM 197198w) TaxID=1432141 RepID=A0A015JZ62_RHIIW|nr:hypothetical protein RirG_252790 [Rhizophagus irregularis DAOM 197198w]